MKVSLYQRFGYWLFALAFACTSLLLGTPARAEEMSAKTLVERQQIEDLITRYYYNLGRENPENLSDFYADDAELILGERHYKGKDGILQAYGRAPGQPPRQAPKRYQFNVTIGNPLIIVHGKTATSQVIFTEYVVEKQGDPLKLTTQGR